jgi:hypothetical protein
MKALLLLNAVALLAAGYLATLQPMLTDLDVKMRYIQLDRAGAINQEVLTTFHPNYGFSRDKQRNTVPQYIAQPALDGQRFNAFILLGLASLNVAVIVLVRKNTVARCPPQEATANTDQPQCPPAADEHGG